MPRPLLMAKNVDFFFDLSSPYSYMAATQIGAIAERNGATLTWKPMVLHAVFQATGNKMPISIAAKGPWMLRDLERWAKQYGVGFKMTSRFPVNAIKPMRLVLVAAREGKAAPCALAAFRALWIDDRDITAESELRAIATAAGLDPDAALKAIEDPAIKDQLRANTDEAVKRGAFGAPAIFVGDELFWGNDRLHHVETALREI
jgi:2-hydroxychromene-2-carboxylate isomerase